MNRHQYVRDSLYEYLLGELSSADHDAIDRHLATCSSCRQDLAVMQEALALLPRPEDDPAAQRSEEFWNVFPLLLEQRIHGTHATRWKLVYRNFLDRALSFAVMRKGQIALAGAATAFVALVVALLLRPPAGDGPTVVAPTQVSVMPHQSPPATTDSSERVGEPVPLRPGSPSPAVQFASSRVSDYFRQSKILLIGIANLKEDPETVPDLSTEGRVSRALVKEARYLKEDQSLDPRAKALIEELNRVLIQLASLAERNDVSGIEIVRGGIRQENLLFKIRMAETAMGSSHPTTQVRPKEVAPS